MRCLALTSTNPSPPRNGVTIPMFNHIEIMLRDGYDVDIAFFASELSAKKTNVNGNELLLFPVSSSKISRVIREIFLRTPYFTLRSDLTLLRGELIDLFAYDVIYYSPISMHQIAEQAARMVEARHGVRPKVVAAISDSYTSVLRSSLINGGWKLGSGLNFVKYLRSLYFPAVERKLLAGASTVLVQTERDWQWLVDEVKIESSRVRVLSNGVDHSLFELKWVPSNTVVFVGNLRSNYYVERLLWFYQNVWTNAKVKELNLRLTVYSGGASSNAFSDLARGDASVRVVDSFVPSLSDIYRGQSICIAPIFKDYGFINKVAEAMAAGLVVLGDVSAFNGIFSVKEKNAAFVAEKSKFVEGLIELASNPILMSEISTNARILAREQFSWEHKSIF